MKILVVKVATGEEVICQVERMEESVFILKNPRTIQFQQMANGQVGAAFMPTLMMADQSKEVMLCENQVIFMSDPDPDFEKRYLENISGIDLSVTAGRIQTK